MNQLASTLSQTLASAIVTAAALSGNVMAACAPSKCGPKQTAAKCGACKAKPAACAASGAKAKCGAKCAPKCAAKSGGCAAKK